MTFFQQLIKCLYIIFVFQGEWKIFGAGLLSSPEEMKFAVSDEPSHPKFDPHLLARTRFDDTTLQTSYSVLTVFLYFFYKN